ncbi:MAG: CsiV family protein [Gammaproteobacteria bacterium]|nr:CsiV family protein [Gammaproteobacteria bacterium]MDP2139247.1 CsiV family protein [Gammaproteobacteria bacterium]MDP2348984.1 CsiV family protein [Gammaproteobacteria bacterium]
MISTRLTSKICLFVISLAFTQPILAAENPTGERWFQVEMTLFTHENSNLDMEIWSPTKLSLGFPERLRKLRKLSDFLQLDDWSILTGVVQPVAIAASAIPADAVPSAITPVQPLVGPRPYAPGESFRLPDFERQSFLALLAQDHDFTGSNRALSQSSAYRVLFHNAWRQPMTRRNGATAVVVSGGRTYNQRSELEGSVSLYFNNTEDRVVFDSNVWLTSFSAAQSSEEDWSLPVLPAVMLAASADENAEAVEYHINRIIQLRQVRDMRSGEFHYIDHPAMGILVQITPYVVPEIPVPGVEELVDPLQFQ